MRDTTKKQSVLLSMIGLLLFHSALVWSQPQGFKHWLSLVGDEAINEGVSKETVKKAIRHIKLLPSVIQLDRKQPEFVTPFLSYYASHVTPKRVVDGRGLLRQYRTLLDRIEQQYGVPKAILVAFWGLETNYGKNLGNIDTLSALATLAYEGRRADFFRAQLLDALSMVDRENLHLRYLKGSWAGAFGHLQFMPSTFKQYAVDGDGNQQIDLKRSIPDALYSAAHYLSSVGWQPRTPAMIEVKLPNDFPFEEASLYTVKSVSAWQAMGVAAVSAVVSDVQFARMHSPTNRIQAIKMRNERSLIAGLNRQAVKVHPVIASVPHQSTNAAIVLPQGWRGPAFMVFENFHTILDWNRSVNYALSVGLLARQLDKKMTLVYGGSAQSMALPRVKVLQLQTMLNNLGFNAGQPDGYPGLQTQSAIRAYQLTQALPADGYATLSLFEHVTANTALSIQ